MFEVSNPNKTKIDRLFVGTELYSRIDGAQELFDYTLRKFVDLGNISVDTAECYGFGVCEKLIARIPIELKGQVKIFSKFGHKLIDGSKQKSFTRDSIEQQLLSSIQNTGRIYLDGYFFHSEDNDTFFRATPWDFLLEQKSKGLINKLGLSVKHDLIVAGDLEQVTSMKKFGLEVLQCVLNPLHPESTYKAIAIAREQKVEILGRIVLAKGEILKLKIEELLILTETDNHFCKEFVDLFCARFPLLIGSLDIAVKTAVAIDWAFKHADSVILAQSSKHQVDLNTSVIRIVSQIGQIHTS